MKLRAVSIPPEARPTEPPPAPEVEQPTKRLRAVSQEEAEAFREVLESERRLRVEREVDTGWDE